MKIRSKILITLLSFIFFPCCKEEKDDGSISFFNYLKETHNINPKMDEHFYIIIELDGCQVCNYDMIESLNNIDINIDKLTVIGSYSGKFKPKLFDSLQIKFKIIYESRKQFYKTPFGFLDNVIIRTRNKNVIEKYVINDGPDLLSYFLNIKKN